jgi:uncharacterized cupin superfamily protein
VTREARLEPRPEGLTAVTDGWFVTNVRDGPWVTNEVLGAAAIFEGEEAPFPQVGYTLGVFQPGESGGMYHHESNQEDFLVLAGEAILIVEGEERLLKAWDFFHCPPGTDHIIVGAGDGPCAVFMTGSRIAPKETLYPRDETALRHGAGVEEGTPDRNVAYAPYPKWQPGPPPSFGGLPWAQK